MVPSGLFPVSHSRRWVVMGLLFLACFANYLDRASISVALPFIQRNPPGTRE